MFASTASESPGKTRSESQKVLLISLSVQQTSTARPVLGASNNSEWNTDDKWSSQEWKSDEMLEARTVRDPWVDTRSPSTQTSSSLMTMIWILTPPQNRIFYKVMIILEQCQ